MIAFVIAVSLITTIALQIVYVNYRNFDLEPLFVEDYTKSHDFLYGELTSAINEVKRGLKYGEMKTSDIAYYYYFIDGEIMFNNITFSKLQDYNYKYEHNIKEWEYKTWNVNEFSDITIDELAEHTLYLAFPDEYIMQKQKEWNNARSGLIPIAVSFIQSIIAVIICIVYLIVVAGRKAEDDEVHLMPYVDRIYSDIEMGAMLIILFLWFSLSYHSLDQNYGPEGTYMNMDQIVSMILIGILTAVSAMAFIIIFLSLVRKLKARKLLKHTLIYTIFSRISNFIKSLFDDSRFEHFPLTKSLNRRQIIFTVSSGIMVFLFFVFIFINLFLGLFPVIIEGLIIFWYFNENKKTFEEINQGFQESHKEMLKSEKMKVDLITNVSHDLKTPLTSIISYVDLLSKEDLPETARDYVNILAEKSNRLKNIVADLFDLAKSTSGNLPLDMENLDLKKLIEQTLADMEDEIAKSNLRIKTTLTNDPVYIYSDGKKLYRVFQNIIGNALKYSLQGTRIFIDMEIVNNRIYVTVKNTAAYDMDFTAEEVLQRFSRGDKSRSTEGSGLGLSIAESFTWACGGTFKVEIDGDQFKVKLGFPISGKSNTHEM